MKKKIVGTMLAIAMGLTTNSFALVFASSNPSSWAVKEVNEAKSEELLTDSVMKDYQANITREQFCELVMKAYKKISGKNAEVGNMYFSDTNNTEILKAAKLGIVSGYGNNIFAPNDLITREQICAMLVRMIDKSVSNANTNIYKDNYFDDKNDISDWAFPSVSFAYDKGIIQGVGNNRIAPLDNTTCEQAILLIKRIFNVYSSDNGSSEENDNIVFKDRAFEYLVRLKIGKNGKPFDGKITKDMLEDITEINTYYLTDDYTLKSIEDIELLPNINTIHIGSRQKVTDYSPITNVKNCKYVDLSGATIDDDSFLESINVSDYMDFPNLPYLGEADYYDNKYTYNDALKLYRQTLDELDYISNNIINDDMSDYDKYKALHDYIILKMRYDMDEYNAINNNNEFDYPRCPHYLSRVLCIGKGVCHDYAVGYASLCSYFGLECYTVSGSADGIGGWEGHLWNIVNVDGNYYHVDTTWDDPDTESYSDTILYDYFLLSDDEIMPDHIIDGFAVRFDYYAEEEVEEIPICNQSYGTEEKDEDYFNAEDEVIDGINYNVEEIIDLAVAELNIPEQVGICVTVSSPEYNAELQEYIIWIEFYEDETALDNGDVKASASWCIESKQFYTRFSDFENY